VIKITITIIQDIIQDMDLGGQTVIIADSPVIYHAIVTKKTVMTMIAENASNVENKVIMQKIVNQIITMTTDGQQKNVLRVERLGTCLATVHDQEVVVMEDLKEDRVINAVEKDTSLAIVNRHAIIVEKLDILLETATAVIVLRNVILAVNMVTFKEIAIGIQSATTVGVLDTRVEIANIRKILKSAIIVNGKDMSREIVLILHNHDILLLVFYYLNYIYVYFLFAIILLF